MPESAPLRMIWQWEWYVYGMDLPPAVLVWRRLTPSSARLPRHGRRGLQCDDLVEQSTTTFTRNGDPSTRFTALDCLVDSDQACLFEDPEVLRQVAGAQ